MSEAKRLANLLEDELTDLGWWGHKIADKAAAELRRLQTENESLRANAERYQHIRDSKWLSLGPVIGIGAVRNRKGVRYILAPVSIFSVPEEIETLDAAIDAARKA